MTFNSFSLIFLVQFYLAQNQLFKIHFSHFSLINLNRQNFTLPTRICCWSRFWMYHHWDLGWPPTEKLAMFFLFCCYWSCNYLQRCSYFFQWIFCISNVQYRYTIQNTDILTISVLRIIGPTQVNRRLLISRILMKWISSIFWKCWQLFYSISKKCWKFIASKMLEIKSCHLTWGGPYYLPISYIR